MDTTLSSHQHKCENCRLHAYADQHPKTLIARFWRWHTNWCPGWKSYLRWKAEREKPAAA